MTDLASYRDLIARKAVQFEPVGLSKIPALNSRMFPHQAHSTEFALRQGCAALFLDTGLGKSFCALEWGRIIAEHCNKPVLMLAPLAVGPQHQREAEKFGINARYVRDPGGKLPDVVITNYERLHLWNADDFAGIILDESSILKSLTGATTQKLIETFAKTPYRMACTATPAPNDHMELGNHSQFLGAMESREMLSRWFINDTSDASQSWRLKGHAVSSFWDWIASWARCLSKPSDAGLPDDGFDLPVLTERYHFVNADRSIDAGDDLGQRRLFRMPNNSATSIHKEKRITMAQRADAVAAAVHAEPSEHWIVWCDTDAEADALSDRLPDAIEVRGSMPPDKKEARLVAFTECRERIIITKPRIAGYGLNWQHCARQAFIGVNYSYEAYYQAIRRSWRFGQSRPVDIHIAMADTEQSIFDAIKRKGDDHQIMKREMADAMRRASLRSDSKVAYSPKKSLEVPAWL